MPFDVYIGVDYSGAATPETRSATIQVFQTSRLPEPHPVTAPGSTASRKRNWSRRDVHEWLRETLRSESRCIIGMDHAFSFPTSYFRRHNLSDWSQFLVDFSGHWPTSAPGSTVESLRRDNQRTGDANELRLSEKWTSSAKSVFKFDVNGSVAKSTHAGLPFLHELREQLKSRVHFWPFDGWQIPSGKSVIAEVYPSLFRNRYPRASRTVDQQDAYSVSRWLMEMDQQDELTRFFEPPLTNEQKHDCRSEGWILGVT